MKAKEITVRLKEGLSSQSACFFIQKANEFASEILVEYQDKKVNAKSLLGVLSLGIAPNTAVRLDVNGKDEAEALAALEEFLG